MALRFRSSLKVVKRVRRAGLLSIVYPPCSLFCRLSEGFPLDFAELLSGNKWVKQIIPNRKMLTKAGRWMCFRKVISVNLKTNGYSLELLNHFRNGMGQNSSFYVCGTICWWLWFYSQVFRPPKEAYLNGSNYSILAYWIILIIYSREWVPFGWSLMEESTKLSKETEQKMSMSGLQGLIKKEEIGWIDISQCKRPIKNETKKNWKFWPEIMPCMEQNTTNCFSPEALKFILKTEAQLRIQLATNQSWQWLRFSS